ncbi:hypothetical protein Scep_004685 [Stephania cephalantha]|uniref:Uncharacterized protein n=1 Tax=Stephania cephalantha TaxID=152367 RepID=A0AAP0PZC5_9MAGN
MAAVTVAEARKVFSATVFDENCGGENPFVPPNPGSQRVSGGRRERMRGDEVSGGRREEDRDPEREVTRDGESERREGGEGGEGGEIF